MTQVNVENVKRKFNVKRLIIFIVTGILSLIFVALGVIEIQPKPPAPPLELGTIEYPYLPTLDKTNTYNAKKGTVLYFTFTAEEDKVYKIELMGAEFVELKDEDNKVINVYSSQQGTGYIRKSYNLKNSVKYTLKITAKSDIVKITIN